MKERPLYEIAREVKITWAKPYFGAVPYIQAMSGLERITDYYGMDTASDIVNRFLANASTFRGPDARRIKAELNNLLKSS